MRRDAPGVLETGGHGLVQVVAERLAVEEHPEPERHREGRPPVHEVLRRAVEQAAQGGQAQVGGHSTEGFSGWLQSRVFASLGRGVRGKGGRRVGYL